MDVPQAPGLSKEKYLKFLENFFALAHLNAKKSTQLAFINADWRDFQGTPARDENPTNSIMSDDYLHIITGSQQIYLPVEIQQMLVGSGKIRIQILGG